MFDKSQPFGSEVALWIDGIAIKPDPALTSDNLNGFGKHTLYLLRRSGQPTFCTGTLDEMKIYSRALSQAEIQDL